MSMITIVIIVLLLVGYLMIATESVHHINKAAVAMFLGVALWCLFILDGYHYVMAEHLGDYFAYNGSHTATFASIKSYIAHSLFVKYALNACGVVLFFLGTMSMVEVLNGNGCFDFLKSWLRTNHSRRLLWALVAVSFLISANLDNLTTATLMLVIMHSLVSNNKLRMVYGSAIVLAVNCGGMFTAIGDVNGLTLWIKGFVTPTNYAGVLVLPALCMAAVPTWLIARKLPQHLDESSTLRLAYRGSEAPLPVWQRLVLLVVGLGGLWFVPTFHRITELPPFVGVFCVLGLIWILNELFNIKLFRSGRMSTRHSPIALQYGNMQMLLFYIGITLAVGATQEMGLWHHFATWMGAHVGNAYVAASLFGLLSVVLDNIVIVITNTAMYPLGSAGSLYGCDGSYWPLLSYMITFGGSMLTIGTVGGFALMRVEGVGVRWYFRHITGKVLVGGLAGLLVLVLITHFL